MEQNRIGNVSDYMKALEDMSGQVLGSAILLFGLSAFVFLVLLRESRFMSDFLQKKFGGLRILLLQFSGSMIAGVTLFGREASEERIKFELRPFWTYVEIAKGDSGLALQVFLNVLLFLPLGLALPLCFDSCRTVRHTIVVSALISAMIELIQGVSSIGLCELDDVFHNVLGALIGYGVFCIFEKCYVSLEKRE